MATEGWLLDTSPNRIWPMFTRLFSCYAAQVSRPNGSTLYQLGHPFHWITYGQNPAGIQAIAAVMGTIAAILAGYFAARAYFETARQVRIAGEQLRVTKEQWETDKRRYEAEAKAARQAALATYERTKAEEDALRPRFSTGSYSRSNAYNLEFCNVGSSIATDVQFLSGITKECIRHVDVIHPDGKITVTVNIPEMETNGVEIRFRTTFGSLWRLLQFTPTQQNPIGERVLDVQRIYQPPA